MCQYCVTSPACLWLSALTPFLGAEDMQKDKKKNRKCIVKTSQANVLDMFVFAIALYLSILATHFYEKIINIFSEKNVGFQRISAPYSALTGEKRSVYLSHSTLRVQYERILFQDIKKLNTIINRM